MSTQLISQIKAHIVDPNLSGENLRLLARESGFDISRNFLASERLELIRDVTEKLLKRSELYLKTLPGLGPKRVLQPSEKEEISRAIEEKMLETCRLNKNSYCGYSTDPSAAYSTDSKFWPWFWSIIGWPTRSDSSNKL